MHLLQPSSQRAALAQDARRAAQARPARDPQGLRLPVALQRRRGGRGAAAPGQDARGRPGRRLQRLRRGRGLRQGGLHPHRLLQPAPRCWSWPCTTASTRAPARSSARAPATPATLATFDDLFAAFETQLRHFLDVKIRGNQIIERHLRRPRCRRRSCRCSSTTASRNGPRLQRRRRPLQQHLHPGRRHRHPHRQPRGASGSSVFDERAIVAGRAGRRPRRRLRRPRAAAPAPASTGRPSTATTTTAPTTSCGASSRRFFDAVDGRPNAQGRRATGIEMLPTTCHVYFGSVTGATPDGRQAGPAAVRGHLAGAGRRPPRPDRGAASRPPRWTTCKTGGTLLNMKFTPVAARRRRRASTSSRHLVRGYFRMDGHHVQFNVVTRRDAARGPGRPRGAPRPDRPRGRLQRLLLRPLPRAAGGDHRPHRARGVLTRSPPGLELGPGCRSESVTIRDRCPEND